MTTMTSPSPLRVRWTVGVVVACLLLHAVRVSAEDRRSSADDNNSDKEVEMNTNTVHSPNVHTDMNTVDRSNTHRDHSVETLRDASESQRLMEGRPGIHGNEADHDSWRWSWSGKELSLARKTWEEQPPRPPAPFRLREKWPVFSSWTGKRYENPTHLEKRQAFSAWAGKRSPHEFHNSVEAAIRGWTSDDVDDGDVDDNIEKRHAFSAWAGKRSEGDLVATNRPALSICHDGQLEKRQAFSAWAGKRNLLPSEAGEAGAGLVKQKDKQQPARARGYKRRFSAWGGKRSEALSRVGPCADTGILQTTLDAENSGVGDAGYEGDDDNQPDIEDHQQSSLDEEVLSLKDKRQAFNAWAGKRYWLNSWPHGSSAGTSDGGNSWDRKGHSQELTSSLLKRLQLDKEHEEKSSILMHSRAIRAALNGWAGTRSTLLGVAQEDTGKYLLNAKRQGFNAWGGK